MPSRAVRRSNGQVNHFQHREAKDTAPRRADDIVCEATRAKPGFIQGTFFAPSAHTPAASASSSFGYMYRAAARSTPHFFSNSFAVFVLLMLALLVHLLPLFFLFYFFFDALQGSISRQMLWVELGHRVQDFAGAH
jgi:hypothetical protein